MKALPRDAIYYLVGAQMYAGNANAIPISDGDVATGAFPNKITFPENYDSHHGGSNHSQSKVQHYTFTVPHSTMSACFAIVAHADVQRMNMPAISSWAAGSEIIPGKPARKFTYCKTNCQ